MDFPSFLLYGGNQGRGRKKASDKKRIEKERKPDAPVTKTVPFPTKVDFPNKKGGKKKGAIDNALTIAPPFHPNVHTDALKRREAHNDVPQKRGNKRPTCGRAGPTDAHVCTVLAAAI